MILLYLALAVLATLPLVLHLGDSFPSEGTDATKYIWNIWWMKKAIELGQNPFYTKYINYPYGSGLVYDAFTPLRGVLSLPLQYLFGVIPAHNLLILGSLAAMGYFTYLLAYKLTGNSQAAFLSGLIFMLSPYVAGKVEAHQNLSELQYIPLFVLALYRLKEKTSTVNLFFASASLVAIFLTDYYQFFLAGILALLFLFLNTENNNQKRALLTSFGITFITISPLLIFFVRDWGYYNFFKIFLPELSLLDPVRFILPPLRSWFYRMIHWPFSPPWGRENEEPFLGLFALLLLGTQLPNLLKVKAARYFIIAFAVAVVFGLGPHLTFNGTHYRFLPLPFALILEIPILQNLRASVRFMIMISFVFSILFAFAYANIYGRISRFSTPLAKIFFLISIGILVLEYLSVPVLLERFDVSNFFYRIRNEPEAFAIWTLPQESWNDITRAALAQTVHEKPALGGFVSRPSQLHYDLYNQLPLIGDIVGSQYENEIPTYDPSVLDYRREEGLKYIKQNKIKYIVIFKNVYGEVYKNQKLVEYFQLFFPRTPHYEDDKIVVYRMD